MNIVGFDSKVCHWCHWLPENVFCNQGQVLLSMHKAVWDRPVASLLVSSYAAVVTSFLQGEPVRTLSLSK